MTVRIKDFDKLYRDRGAYHVTAQGFDAWFLEENYGKIARYCRPGDTILDLGCGEGRLSDYISDVRAIDGIDYLQSALDLNRAVYGQRYRHLFQFHLKDLGSIKIKPRSYDRIVSSLTLMYLAPDELLLCLKGARKLLRDDGLLVATYPNQTGLRAPSRESYELPLSQVQRIFAAANLGVDEIEPVCPFLPKEVVSQSFVDQTVETARQYFLEAKSRLDMDNAYHFLIAAGKAKSRRFRTMCRIGSCDPRNSPRADEW